MYSKPGKTSTVRVRQRLCIKVLVLGFEVLHRAQLQVLMPQIVQFSQNEPSIKERVGEII